MFLTRILNRSQPINKLVKSKKIAKKYNKIDKHFEKKAITVKLAACEINKDNKKWRESKYHKCGDDVILL